MVIGNSNVGIYDFLRDSYTGGGGYLNGRYIIPHPREAPQKVEVRRQLSHYSNFVKPIVDSLVNPVFRRGVVRDWDIDSELLSAFMEDVDRTGEGINRFMKRAAMAAKLYGSAFIVVDNSKTVATNKAKAIEERQFPYLYLVPPSAVNDYKCDSFGRLISITYTVEAVASKSLEGDRIRGDEDEWTWTRESWSVKRHTGVAEEGKNLLGEVPIVCLKGAETDVGDLMPLSPVMSAARTNLAIYNLTSELRELLRNQAFSVLCYPITQEVTPDRALEGVKIGTNDMLLYDGGGASTAPHFIAPDSSQAQLLQSEISRLVEDIYRQASLTSVVAVQTRTSGVAREWDFECTNQVLTEMAENCEIAERKIMALWEKYTGSKVTYKVIYPREFGIVDVVGELEKVAQALNLNVSPGFAKQAKIKAVEAFLNDIPTKEYDSVVEEIRTSSEDSFYSIATGSNGITYNIQGKPSEVQGTKMNGARQEINEGRSEEKENG